MASLRSAGTAAVSTGSQLAGRAVHIKIYPRPRNLSESRQVLGILERYGQVVMFKNLRHELLAPAPNSALAIYQYASSASDLVNSSPLTFTLNDGQTGRGMSMDGSRQLHGSRAEPTPAERNSGSMAFGSNELGEAKTHGQKRDSKADGDDEDATCRIPHCNGHRPPRMLEHLSGATHRPREFHLTAAMSHFNHRAYIERQPHYAGFKPDLKSIAAEGLAESVPLLGLRDLGLRKAEVPARVVNKRAQELAQRKTLTELWEEGLKKA